MDHPKFMRGDVALDPTRSGSSMTDVTSCRGTCQRAFDPTERAQCGCTEKIRGRDEHTEPDPHHRAVRI
jgi:hypothetical protein